MHLSLASPRRAPSPYPWIEWCPPPRPWCCLNKGGRGSENHKSGDPETARNFTSSGGDQRPRHQVAENFSSRKLLIIGKLFTLFEKNRSRDQQFILRLQQVITVTVPATQSKTPTSFLVCSVFFVPSFLPSLRASFLVVAQGSFFYVLFVWCRSRELLGSNPDPPFQYQYLWRWSDLANRRWIGTIVAASNKGWRRRQQQQQQHQQRHDKDKFLQSRCAKLALHLPVVVCHVTNFLGFQHRPPSLSIKGTKEGIAQQLHVTAMQGTTKGIRLAILKSCLGIPEIFDASILFCCELLKDVALELLDSWSTTPRLHPQGWGVVGWPHSEVIIDHHPFPLVGWKNSPNLHQQRKIKVENSFILIIYPMQHSNSSSYYHPIPATPKPVFFQRPSRFAKFKSPRANKAPPAPATQFRNSEVPFNLGPVEWEGKFFLPHRFIFWMKIRCPGTPGVWFWQLQVVQTQWKKKLIKYSPASPILDFSLQCRPESAQTPYFPSASGCNLGKIIQPRHLT